MEKLNNIAKKQVKKIKEKKDVVVAQNAATKKTETLPAVPADITPEGIEALATMTYDKLFEESKTPHEELARQLITGALDGEKKAVNMYWDLQKEIYKANAKKPNQSFKIEVKRDEILSRALDNIQSEVLEGETILNQEDIDKKE